MAPSPVIAHISVSELSGPRDVPPAAGLRRGQPRGRLPGAGQVPGLLGERQRRLGNTPSQQQNTAAQLPTIIGSLALGTVLRVHSSPQPDVPLDHDAEKEKVSYEATIKKNFNFNFQTATQLSFTCKIKLIQKSNSCKLTLQVQKIVVVSREGSVRPCSSRTSLR